MNEQITKAPADEYDPANHYPPDGTPESCLIIVIDCDQFRVLGHTGRFFHGQINCAGLSEMFIGIENVPDEHGYFVMENGSVSCGLDYDSGVADDVSICGDWRPATLDDFDRFDVDVPACMAPAMTVSVGSEFKKEGAKVGPLVMCNRMLSKRVTMSDPLDEHGTRQIFIDFESFLVVTGWHPSDGGRHISTEAANLLTMWFDARALAKEEDGRVEGMINVAGGKISKG